MFDDLPRPPASALEYLAGSQYGFSLVDIGVAVEDLDDFDRIEVGRKKDYNRCGELAKIEEEVGGFLQEIGDTPPDVIARVARRIAQIVDQFFRASQKETAWVCLRASIPADAARELFWHFDWPYYPTKDAMQYRFVMTLTGPPTLFYPIPMDDGDLRRTIWKRMNNRKFMRGLCDLDRVFVPNRDLGVVFVNRQMGALHSEPSSFTVPRLFLSIIPCSKGEMEKLEPRVKEYFTGGERSHAMAGSY